MTSWLLFDRVRLVLIVFGVYLTAIALLALVAPHLFFEKIGPFGAYNPHYTRDGATFELALGAGALGAAALRAWRVPVLAILAFQSLLHALNHLADIAAARPRWLGPFDFAALALGTAVLVWALARARSGEQAS